MNGAGLNLLGKALVIKIDRTSILKYDQLARFTSCAFGAPCTMNKNALSSAICTE